MTEVTNRTGLPTSYQELLDSDTHPVPEVLRRVSTASGLGTKDLSIDRYVERAYHEREVERLWKRVWQMVCRESISSPATTTCTTSQGCRSCSYGNPMARSRRFRTPPAPRPAAEGLRGLVRRIALPVPRLHVDARRRAQVGSVAMDFPQVSDEEFHLPELPVGRWGGFVFINPDQDAAPFEDWIAELAEHFSIWKFEDRYVEVHVAKVIAANWKVTQEAFCEAYHVAGTPSSGDAVSRRRHHPGGLLGQHLSGHHPCRLAQPAARLGSHRGRHVPGHVRHPGGRGPSRPDRTGRDDALGGGADGARALASDRR
ncbi:MAG: SRPBCC family protein [Ilumatobacteraceae bacterium]